jgi:hypothetical protein
VGRQADNKSTIHVIINLNTTQPVINITSPEDKKAYLLGESIPLIYTIEDNLSGMDTQAITLDGIDIAGQSAITPSVGEHTLIINALDKAGNAATRQITFTASKIKAEVTVKPEIFPRSKGVFIAFVKLPPSYQHEPIIEVSCDGAPAKKIIPTRKGTILIFRREDITQKPIDITFTVTGKLKNGLLLEGTDTIKKVFSFKDFFNRAKDKANEHAEFDGAVDKFCGSSSEANSSKEHIRALDN